MISKLTPQVEQTAATGYARRVSRAIGADALMNVSHEEIARRAYDIYMRSAMLNGHDTRNWYQAEYELRHQRIRDALLPETVTTMSRGERYSEVLNGRNPRAAAPTQQEDCLDQGSSP